MTGRFTYVQRATAMLEGIVAGIACDYRLEDAEIAGLVGWLEMHAGLLGRAPFAELDELVRRVLEDGVVEEHEREELLDWCATFNDERSAAVQHLTHAARRLHGVLQGIAIDGHVTDDEVRDLQDWLLDHETFKKHWPFDEVGALVDRILADGVVTEAERQELLAYCRDFSEVRSGDPAVHDAPEPWSVPEAPVLQTLDAICDRDAVIEFAGRSFCFTGQARSGKRKDLERMVIERGGTCRAKVAPGLDYLVIGANSQPAWAYSAYGRKIERVMNGRREGWGTVIVHEERFHSRAAESA